MKTLEEQFVFQEFLKVEVSKYIIEKMVLFFIYILIIENLHFWYRKPNWKKEILIDENITAPLEYLQKVGTINYKLNGEIIGQGNIVSGSKVEEKRWDDFFAEVSGVFFRVGR